METKKRSEFPKVRYSEIQEEILDKAIKLIFIVGVLVTLLFLYRSFYVGVKAAQVVQLILIMILAFFVYKKDQLSYNLKANVLIYTFFIAGIGDFISYGIFGGGVVFFTASTICSLVFKSLKAFVLNFIFATLLLVLTSQLYHFNIVSYPSYIVDYLFSIESWGMTLLIFFICFAIINVFVGNLILKVKDAIDALSNKNDEFIALNNSLDEMVNVRTTELQQANLEKDQILGVIAHDVNNQIGGMISYLELLLLEADNLSKDELKDFIRNIHSVGSDAGMVVKDLLDYSSLDSKKEHQIYETLNICEFINTYAANFYPRAQKKNITITQLCHLKLNCNIKGNVNRLSRVLDNLITNAIKFTPVNGTIELDGKIDSDKREVIISISDSGIGIPEKMRNEIFKPFSKAGRLGTENEESNGLGLSISKSIIEQHGGRIWMESNVSHGTIFYIALPLIETEASEQVKSKK